MTRFIPSKLIVIFVVTAIVSVTGCSSNVKTQHEAQAFIDEYTDTYVHLRTVSTEASWLANIRIVEGDSTNGLAAIAAKEAMTAFTGSEENSQSSSSFLDQRDRLTDLQVKQLESILYRSANYPAVAEEAVKMRIAAETRQNEALYGYDFQIDGESVTTNDLDDILKESNDVVTRLEAWEESKQVGIGLKDGLVNLVELRNETVQSVGYDDFFQYMVSDYGMTVDELIAMTQRFNEELRPLYRELHTYARYELADSYGEAVPELLPAHWLPNRWGQDWSPMVEVEGLDLDAALADKSAEYLVRAGEDFFISLGYPPLPHTFYELSSMYPLPPDAGYKKNNHASAWHFDLEDDVRCLMSVIPNAEWWETIHHELGHIYYFLACTDPNVPPLLRKGANRAYHEAIGSLLGLASMQQPFLVHVGLMDSTVSVDPIQTLLREAMSNVVFIPWSAGVMTEFERDLYASPLSADEYNARWWELKRQYQGIVPPSERGEEFCDAASKTHINGDPAGYYDYALSFILLQQLHEKIAVDILKQDPHATNYYGNEDVGDFLWSILEVGGTGDWREILQEKLGSEISADATLRYFEPLYEWLLVQNEDRTSTLPEL
jgi:peptidyl-dipeptidase A